jgi:hypothetical protein
MADFLNRLAARTLGIAPIAQPIIPTLFAPGPKVEGEVSTQGEPAAESLETFADLNPVGPSVIGDAPARPSSIDLSFSPPLQYGPDAGSKGRGQPLTPELGDTPRGSREKDEVILPSRRAQTSDREAAETPAALPSKPVTETYEESSLLEVPPRRFAEPHPWLPKAITAPAYDPVHASEAINRPGDTRAPQRTVINSEPHAPVIRVTIGRIDVRAEFPSPSSAPSTTKRTRSSALSLEAYLRQRNGGRR